MYTVFLYVTIPPAVRPTLLQQMDVGSLTYAQTWMRVIHTKIGCVCVCGGGGVGGGVSATNKSAQELTRRDRQLTVSHRAPP